MVGCFGNPAVLTEDKGIVVVLAGRFCYVKSVPELKTDVYKRQDPKRQHAPKAWEGMSASEKSEALYDFTKESLAELLDAGVDVGMVQVGNEINNGMAGEEDVDTVMDLIASGSRAVREIAKDYGKAVSYTHLDVYKRQEQGANIAFGFIFSEEFQNLNLCNEHYVDSMYAAFFDREGDAAGKADWLGRCV